MISRNKNTPQWLKDYKRDRRQIVAICFLLVASIVLACYPSTASWWNSKLQAEELTHYSHVETPNHVIEAVWAEAEDYNITNRDQPLAVVSPTDDMYSERYRKQLLVPGSEYIARVTVPNLSIDLPVYHGTSNAVLDKGAGHLYGTSLPVAMPNTLSLLSAHTGLPTQKMFSDLNKIKIGGSFFVSTLGKTMEYKVTRTVTVSPEEAAKMMKPKDGPAVVALITCTPWAVNTSRFVAFGDYVRTLPPDDPSLPKLGISEPLPWYLPLGVAGVLVIIFGGGYAVSRSKQKHFPPMMHRAA